MLFPKSVVLSFLLPKKLFLGIKLLSNLKTSNLDKTRIWKESEKEKRYDSTANLSSSS